MIEREIFNELGNVGSQRAVATEERIHHREEHHDERAFEQSWKECPDERAEKRIDEASKDEEHERQDRGFR